MIYLPEKQSKSVRNLVLLTGVVTTFAVWPPLTDPINLPKMFALTVLATWIFGTVISGIYFSKSTKFTLGQYAIVAFAVGIFLAGLLTDVKFTAFFGAAQRNDGAFSYLALATLSLAAMMSFGSANIPKLRLTLLVMGSVLTVYGLVQHFGHDPFKWVSLYSPIIGTLGNPDFMSALIGALAIATVWFLLGQKRIWPLTSGILLLVGEIYILKVCGSLQGLIGFASGAAILVIFKLWQMNKRIGIVASVVVAIGSLPVLLGVLDKGPIARQIYRASLESRKDYWHAALSMFAAHPFAGVGLDRFGENYAKYRPQIEVVQGQSSDNAHNVYLQLLSTGGLMVVLPYLFLLGVIFFTALKAIQGSSGNVQMDIIGLFAIWGALLIMSFVSIDNLGVAVWTWILGGVLYAISRKAPEREDRKLAKKQGAGRSVKIQRESGGEIVAPIVSLLLTILILLPMVLTVRSSATMQSLLQYRGQLTQVQLAQKLHQIAGIQRSNPQTLINLTQFSFKYSRSDLALEFSKSLVAKDPKSLTGNDYVAAIFELTKKYDEAIPYRIRLLTLDPWNTKSMLLLVKDYVALKQGGKATEIVSRITKLQPAGDDAKAALALMRG